MGSAQVNGNGTAGWTVGDLAQATGLSQRVLRHWEQLGLVTPDRNPSGHRRYGPSEITRLHDQADTLSELLHADTGFPAGSTVLEVGCGVGAQTVTVAERSPGATLTAIDLSAASLAAARKRTRDAGLTDIAFVQADVYALLTEAGYADVVVSPRLVYVDGSRPQYADRFIRTTFTAMIEGIREPALAAGLIAPGRFDAGIRDLLRTNKPDGTFCYTFFKATARV